MQKSIGRPEMRPGITIVCALDRSQELDLGSFHLGAGSLNIVYKKTRHGMPEFPVV